MIDNDKVQYLEGKARRIRYLTVDAIGHLGVGHIGGCLSVADMLAVLYFDTMHINPGDPNMKGRDRFVMSKGHAGPALYAALAERGYFDVKTLYTLNQPGTLLPSHCDMLRTPGVDMTAGSLGQGISCAVGIALAAKITGGKEFVFACIGDGESQEGQVWESAMAAAHYKLNNLIVFLDYNKMQIDGNLDEVMGIGDPVAKFEAFGFFTQRINGHDVRAIANAISHAKKSPDRPTMIVMDTIKGKGVKFAEEAGAGSHSMSITSEQRKDALNALSTKGAK